MGWSAIATSKSPGCVVHDVRIDHLWHSPCWDYASAREKKFWSFADVQQTEGEMRDLRCCSCFACSLRQCSTHPAWFFLSLGTAPRKWGIWNVPILYARFRRPILTLWCDGSSREVSILSQGYGVCLGVPTWRTHQRSSATKEIYTIKCSNSYDNALFIYGTKGF